MCVQRFLVQVGVPGVVFVRVDAALPGTGHGALGVVVLHVGEQCVLCVLYLHAIIQALPRCTNHFIATTTGYYA